MSAIPYIPQNPILPMHVIDEIIAEVAHPGQEDEYTLEPLAVSTLLSLCRTSREIQARSVVHLYRRLSFQYGHQVHRLVAARIPHAGLVRSLLLTNDASFCKNEETCAYLEDAAHLLGAVRPTLERLVFDGVRVERASNLLNRACRDMPVLSDFIYIANLDLSVSFYTPPTPHVAWPTIRRLALLGGDIAFKKKKFPALEVLVMSSQWCNPELVETYIEEHPALRRVLVIMSDQWKWSSEPGRAFVGRKNAVAAAHPHVTIMDVYTESNELASDEWCAEHGRRGTVWTLSGLDWITLA